MLDNFAIFSDDQAITVDAASTKDHLFMDHIGQGEPVLLDIRVTEDFAALTSLKLKVQQTTEADDAWASPEDVLVTPEVLLADLVAGARPFFIQFLPKVTKPRVRLYFDVTGDAATAGKIFAAVDISRDDTYGDGTFYSPRNPSGAADTA